MTIYLVEHSDSDFSGFVGGVDFWHGRGSTSSKADALRLQGLGHKVVGPGTSKPIAAEGVGQPAPSVVSLDEAAHAAQDAVERNPDSAWSKRKAAEADKRKAKRRSSARRHT